MGGEYGSKEVVVVGAGLAGLTAALNLARDGKEVTVLEKFGRPGGIPLAHPAVDVTPMEPDKLGKFIGVELGEPYVSFCRDFPVYFFGHKVDMNTEIINLHCVERGHRKSALDHYLYELCLDAGVKFEFEHPLVSQGDFAQLPIDSVIATGLYFEAFEALNMPYVKVFGYLGKGKYDKDYPSCSVWFHDYILEYAYYGAANGAVFCLYFAREPVKDSEFDEFQEKMLMGQQGMECQRWDYYEGLVPTAAFNTPRLFAGDKILAGTLSGMIDPFALFGVHGSLVSGKIAAIAHRDKAEAYSLFKEYTRFYNRNLLIRRVFNATPIAIRKLMGPQIEFTQKYPQAFKKPMNDIFKGLPGYMRLPD
jgi:NAD(P)-binding Rossmann-like domain